MKVWVPPPCAICLRLCYGKAGLARGFCAALSQEVLSRAAGGRGEGEHTQGAQIVFKATAGSQGVFQKATEDLLGGVVRRREKSSVLGFQLAVDKFPLWNFNS